MTDSAARSDVPERPRTWSRAVACAGARLLGATQREAAGAAGVGERTLRGWERAPWWADAVREASTLWLAGLAAKARRTLDGAVDEDGRLALAILERLEPKLSPRVHVAVGVDYTTLDDDALRRIAAGEPPERVLG